MPKLSDLPLIAARLIGTENLSKAVLAINAAAATTVKTTNAINYMIDGILYTKAALAAQALSALAGSDFSPAINYTQPNGGVGFYVQPINTTVYYVFYVNAAGTVKVVQGTYDGQPLAPTGQGSVGKSMVPDAPDQIVGTGGWCPFGMVKVVTNGATTFTPGTDALDKAGCTFTFYDIAVLPATLAP